MKYEKMFRAVPKKKPVGWGETATNIAISEWSGMIHGVVERKNPIRCVVVLAQIEFHINKIPWKVPFY